MDTDDVDSGRDTASIDTDSGDDTGPIEDSGDTGEPSDTAEPVEPFSQEMIKAFYGPKMADETAHAFSHPDDLMLMGFNLVDMNQYVLFGPDGVVESLFSEKELTDRLHRFAETDLQVSLTYVPGYTASGDVADAVWGVPYANEGADVAAVMDHLTSYMVESVPLLSDLGVYQVSVYEADWLFHESNAADGSPNFDAVSTWSQAHLAAMEAAGWGDQDDEQLVWKFGYAYVPYSDAQTNVSIDVDFSGYDGAGFSVSADDASWDSDVSHWSEGYRDQVDRYLAHFSNSLPDASVWPAVTEFGAGDASCGHWIPDSECEFYWTEDHIEAAYQTVLSAVADWNLEQDVDVRGVYVLDSPSDSGLFGIGFSQPVREAIQEGMAALE